MSKNINSGAKWSDNEIYQLVEEINNNKTTEEIAQIHGRSIGGSESKIVWLMNQDINDGKTENNDIKSNSTETKKLYVLECTNKKYYVGTTVRNLNDRVDEHFSNNGSEWTKKYKPIRVIESLNIINGSEEDIYTKKYMQKYGIQNVRGGSYSKIILDDYKIKALEDEFCTANNLCFKCGKAGHFSNKCNADTWCCEFCDMEFKTLKLAEDHEKICKNTCDKKIPAKIKSVTGSCNRCGRVGHYEKNCYATTNTDGYDIESDDSFSNIDESDDMCHRCGRNGHCVNMCYAKTHISGKYLK